MRSRLGAQACVHSAMTLYRWYSQTRHLKVRFGDKYGHSAPCTHLSPHAKPGRHQASKSGKRKPDSLSKQNKMLSALSREPVNSSERQAQPEVPCSDTEPDVTVVKRASGPAKTKNKQIPLEGSIYDHPVIYDWAFGFRDYEAEVDFLFDVYEDIVGEEPLSFLELGCGPAQHSMEMAESQLKVFCVDKSLPMLEYASAMAAADDIELTRLQADMQRFSLPGGERVDLAACLLGTLHHLLTQDEVRRTLNCVKDALAPKGLFIIELNHPSQLFDGDIVSSADMWTLEVEDAQLEVFWGHEGDEFDPFTQVLDKSIEIDVMLRGGERKVLKDKVQLRQFTYQEMLHLAHSAGFKVVRTYEGFSLASLVGVDAKQRDDALDKQMHVNASMQNKMRKQAEEEAEDPIRMVLVLQKQ